MDIGDVDADRPWTRRHNSCTSYVTVAWTVKCAILILGVLAIVYLFAWASIGSPLAYRAIMARAVPIKCTITAQHLIDARIASGEFMGNFYVVPALTVTVDGEGDMLQALPRLLRAETWLKAADVHNYWDYYAINTTHTCYHDRERSVLATSTRIDAYGRAILFIVLAWFVGLIFVVPPYMAITLCPRNRNLD